MVEFPSLHQLSRYGYLGVELLFIISGFVILMTAYNRTIQSFVASQVARLYPATGGDPADCALQQCSHRGREPTSIEASAT